MTHSEWKTLNNFWYAKSTQNSTLSLNCDGFVFTPSKLSHI